MLWALLFIGSASSALVEPTVWPRPSQASYGDSSLQVSPKLMFEGGNDINTLSAAYKRYSALIFPHPGAEVDSSSSLLSVVNVRVDDVSEAYPQLETDESYELSITNAEATLSARNVYGALRGLETLSQLISYDFEKSQYLLSGVPVSISDTPRYMHRGILMDTSRHFQPISSLERLIEAMSYAKLNGKIFRQ